MLQSLLVVLLLGILLSVSNGGPVEYIAWNQTVVVTIFVGSSPVKLYASPSTNATSLAHDFCASHAIEPRQSCILSVAVEISDSLFCSGGPSLVSASDGPNVPGRRTFRFIHSPKHFESDEFELLRETFQHYGYSECWSGTEMGGRENVVWLLGSIAESYSGERMLLDLLSRGSPSTPPADDAPSHFRFNSWMAAPEAGNKDRMAANLLAFAASAREPALVDLPFLPRTFFVSDLSADTIATLQGTFVLKVPDIELGGGISVVDLAKPDDREKVMQCKLTSDRGFLDAKGVLWGDSNKKGSCILQKYVEPPLLFRPYPGSGPKKFSFGVYTHVTLDPMNVFIHDELLVLFASRPFGEVEVDAHNLSHMTNGLLNRRLNAEYDASIHVWSGAKFRANLRDSYGVTYEEVLLPQVREIVATTMAATMLRMRNETTEAASRMGTSDDGIEKAFVYWRHDFLVDHNFKVWLLEVEIVPSTGTIGGVDEVLKRRVMHDTMAMISDSPPGGGQWDDGDVTVLDERIAAVFGNDDLEAKRVVRNFEAKRRRAAEANKQPIDYTSKGWSGPGDGGFECVVPCLNDKVSEVERAVGAELARRSSFRSDEVLRRWHASSGGGREPLSAADGGGDGAPAATTAAAPFVVGSSSVLSSCETCVSSSSNTFCFAPQSLASFPSVTFYSACQPASHPCLYSLHPFYDALRLTSAQQCSSTFGIFGGEEGGAHKEAFAKVIASAGIARNATEGEQRGLHMWCETLLSGVREGGDWRHFEYLCNF